MINGSWIIVHGSWIIVDRLCNEQAYRKPPSQLINLSTGQLLTQST
jgi:hypothetical protein